MMAHGIPGLGGADSSGKFVTCAILFLSVKVPLPSLSLTNPAHHSLHKQTKQIHFSIPFFSTMKVLSLFISLCLLFYFIFWDSYDALFAKQFVLFCLTGISRCTMVNLAIWVCVDWSLPLCYSEVTFPQWRDQSDQTQSPSSS
jgi:hypothetical protein